MPRWKLILAVLTAVALLCLGSAPPASAQEQAWPQRGFGLDVSVSYGVGAGYKPTLGIGVGGSHTSSRTQTFFGGSGGPAEKTGQTEGKWWALHLGEKIRVTKNGSAIITYTKGCFEGVLFDSCAERLSGDWCYQPDNQGFCFGVTAPIDDIHDYGDAHIKYLYVLPERRLFGQRFSLNVNSGRTRVQGVAGISGFHPETGMSDEFKGTAWIGGSYGLSF